MLLLFFHGAFHPKALDCSQRSKHQENPKFNSSYAAGQRLKANPPGTKPFLAGCMRHPELCSKYRSGIISVTAFTTVLLQFFPPYFWRQEHERSLTLASLAPHLQHPAAEGVTAHLCHRQFLRNNPMGKAPEQMQFSIWCPDHRNKAYTFLHITLAFHCTRKKKN